MSRVKELESKLTRISAQLNTLQEEKIFGSDTVDKTDINEMISLLKEQYFKIVDELETIRQADYSDGELDFYNLYTSYTATEKPASLYTQRKS